MNKKIELSYEGKDYTLEYDRDSIRVMEANGLKINEIENQPLTMTTLLWQGAFLKNHRKENAEQIQKMYEHMPDRKKLNAGLISMFTETYTALLGDNEEETVAKNVEWKMA